MNEANHAIDYGMFIMPYHPPTKPLAQCFDEDLELIVKAEQLGFSDFWIGEHHTMKYEPIVMPEIFIGRALGETTSIRMGPAPVCLNQHHPAHVASRLAFLDHLSHGRLNLCFGPGSVTTEMELYGHEPKDAGPMALEAAEMILKLWQSEPPYEIEEYQGTGARVLQFRDGKRLGIGATPPPPSTPPDQPGNSTNASPKATAPAAPDNSQVPTPTPKDHATPPAA